MTIRLSVKFSAHDVVVLNDWDIHMSAMRLYITYTKDDLEEYARYVGKLASDQGWVVIYGPNEGFEQDRLNSIKTCDGLLALAAYIYGQRLSGPEIHEQEWDAARKEGKLTGALLVDPESDWPPKRIESLAYPDRKPHLESFKKKLKEGDIVEYFKNDFGSVCSSAQQLLNKFKESASKKAEISVFVVWDFTIRGLKYILARFLDKPPEGYQIEVPGIEEKSSAGEIFRDIVLPGIRKSKRVLVVTDRPNANVAFEAGLAIGFGKPICLAHFGSIIPSWLQESVFKGFIVKSIKDLKDLRELVINRDSWYTPPHCNSAPPFGPTLFLSPQSYVGAALREVQCERYPFWKYPRDSFNLNDIAEFSDVAQVVWTIASYSDGMDVRDGAENAANGVISGWFYARTYDAFANKAAKRLHVVRQEDVRKVVDVEVIEMKPFSHLDDFVDRLSEVEDLRLPMPESLPKKIFGDITYEMVNVPQPKNFDSKIEKPNLWVGIYPITNRQYSLFCEDTGYPQPEFWNSQSFDEDQPVVQVSYEDAVEFCKWANLELPTEECWEHFARAGSKERYWWGDDDSLLSEVAWYKDNADNHPHRVGTRKPNTWGIYDALGNVWEWTKGYLQTVSSPYSDVETTSDRAKVCGGAYNSEAKNLHTSAEKVLKHKSTSIGFRCIRIESIPVDND